MLHKFILNSQHAEWNFIMVSIGQDHSIWNDRLYSIEVIYNWKDHLLKDHFYDLFYPKYHLLILVFSDYIFFVSKILHKLTDKLRSSYSVMSK